MGASPTREGPGYATELCINKSGQGIVQCALPLVVKGAGFHGDKDFFSDVRLKSKQRLFFFYIVKGVFINTLVGGGGWAKWRGDQKSFELPIGGTKKFSAVNEGGQKSLVKLKV